MTVATFSENDHRASIRSRQRPAHEPRQRPQPAVALTSPDLPELGRITESRHAARMTQPNHAAARRLLASATATPPCRRMADDRGLEIPEFPDSGTTLADFCCFDDYDARVAVEERYEELADYNDSAARCHRDGWFYSDDD